MDPRHGHRTVVRINRMSRRTRRLVLVHKTCCKLRGMRAVLLSLLLTVSVFAQVKTRAERTDYIETSRYEDVVAFLNAVTQASPLVHTTTFGYSFEGRPLPLAVVGKVPDAKPATIR